MTGGGIKTQDLTKRFLKALEDDYLIIKMDHVAGRYGMISHIGGYDIMRIDHYKGDILVTLVHELLHKLYEKKSHKWIYEQEKHWMRKSSWSQKKQVIQAFLNLV